MLYFCFLSVFILNKSKKLFCKNNSLEVSLITISIYSVIVLNYQNLFLERKTAFSLYLFLPIYGRDWQKKTTID